MKNFVEYIGGITPEKKIVPGTFVGGGVFRSVGTLRRVANKLSRTGKYFRVLAGNRGRVFNLRVDLFIRRGLQHGFGSQGLADAETFAPLQLCTYKIFISRGGAYRKNFRREEAAN